MEVSRHEQLLDAIPEGDGDIGDLRELLSCSPGEEQISYSYVMINIMLCVSAERNCPQACRLICERRLHTRLKNTYYGADKWHHFHQAAHFIDHPGMRTIIYHSYYGEEKGGHHTM